MPTIPPGPYEVQVASVGNPDHGQHPDFPLPGVPSGWLLADTLAECSVLCREYIATHGLGGGNWAGGLIRREGQPGTEFAHVSYNGRVWHGTDPSAWPKTEIPV